MERHTMTHRNNPYADMPTHALEAMRDQIDDALADRGPDAEELAERRYFDRHDPAYVADMRGDYLDDGPRWFEPGADAGPEDGDW
jgi:hypothetical protein